MRYGKEHKQATKQRIIEAAGQRFKTDGIDGSGIATLMADAGLTNGAFYAHFDSKDDLVVATVVDQLQGQTKSFAEKLAQPGGIETLVREYLSPRHRDNPAGGCPSAALLGEVSRCGAAAREAYTAGVLVSIDVIADRLDPRRPERARARALSAFSTMVGALQLSRALTDPALSNEVLERGTDAALAEFGLAKKSRS